MVVDNDDDDDDRLPATGSTFPHGSNSKTLDSWDLQLGSPLSPALCQDFLG